jgi:geranylgeranyl diphosphate synthase, type II
MKDPAVYYGKLLEREITSMRFGKQPTSLYEPIRYMMQLGGKRIRPLLTLLSYSLFNDRVEGVVPYAVAVEAFHNFTLMHDDIMDHAPLRRGKPTVHEKWNVSTAILSGDVMLVKVYEMFSRLDPEIFKETVQSFNQCASRVCEGQQWDMSFEKVSSISETQYLQMIKAKTAVLLGFSLELGAILADASKQERKVLREFGTNIGMGFQLKDDLLDAYGDPEKFGKQVGGDIIANKKTFLLIKAFDKASPSQRKELQRWLSLPRFNKKKKVNAVVSIYDTLRIPSLTQRKVDYYFSKAFRLLDSLPESPAKDNLREFTCMLIDRNA